MKRAVMHGLQMKARHLARFASPSLMAWIAVAALLLASTLVSETFVQPSHLVNVARQSSCLLVVTVGQILVMITGGLDLSNGAVMTLVNVLTARLLNGSDAHVVPVILLCLGLGAAVGLLNGFLVALVKIPALLATLGTFGVLKGVAHVLTDGAPKGAIPPLLRSPGSGSMAGAPVSVLLAAAVAVGGWFLLNRTTFGRRLYFVGANRNAARLSGIPVHRIIVIAHVLSGLCAAIAGLVASGYTGVASLSIGDAYHFNSITAAVLGGTALAGGMGSVGGGIAGVAFMAILGSLMRFAGISYNGQLILQGTVLGFSVIVQTFALRRRG